MSTEAFDTLLDSLSSSVSEARRSLSLHHQGQLRRIYSDDNGKSLTWTFYVPSDETDDGYRPVELPLVSLRSSSELNISELSIALTCSIETATSNDLRRVQKSGRAAEVYTSASSAEIKPERPLVLVIKSAKDAIANGLARVKILLSPNKSEGRVFVNRKELKIFDIEDSSR